MVRPPPSFTRPATLFPDTTLFRSRLPGPRAPTCFPGRSEAEIRGPPLHRHRPATVRRPAWAPDLRAARSVRGSRQWGSRADLRATFLAKRGGAAMTTRFAVDDLVIHRIVEQETPSPDAAYRPQVFFPDLTDAMLEANRGWLTGNGLDPVYGNILLCYQTYIVRTPHHTVLIDTCIGNEKNHPTRPHWHGKTDATYMRALEIGRASCRERVCQYV